MSKKILHSEKDLNGVTIDLYEREVGHLEIYADGIQGMMMGESVVKFNFFTDKMSFEEKNRDREIVCTMVMPIQQVEAIAKYFTSSYEQMKDISLQEKKKAKSKR